MIKKFQITDYNLIQSDSVDSPVQVYINPDQDERKLLLSKFDIDEHTLSSALDPDEVSRVEFTPGYVFLILKRPTNYSGQDNFYFDVTSVGLFLMKDTLIMILPGDILLTESTSRQAPKINSLLDVMLTFLYQTTRHYLEHLKVIKMVSREIQQRINTSMENKHLIQMFNLSESLIYYLNAINANSVALSKLHTYGAKGNFPPEAIELLDDIIIENNQCYKQAEIYSTIFSGLMDARGSLVNNNMNVLLKKLTIINVVFMPLNLIASVGGMSEFSMMTQGIDWRISYSLFFIAIILIGFLTSLVLSQLNFGSNNSPKPRRKKGIKFWVSKRKSL
jgi:magnesium transporter